MKHGLGPIAGLAALLASCNSQPEASNRAENAAPDYGTLADTAEPGNAAELDPEDAMENRADAIELNAASVGPYPQSQPDSDETVRNKHR